MLWLRYVVLCCLALCCLALPCLALPCLALPCLALLYVVCCCVVLCCVVSCCVVSRCVVSCLVLSCVVSCRVVSSCVVLCMVLCSVRCGVAWCVVRCVVHYHFVHNSSFSFYLRFIMNELLQTERAYVADLKCVMEVRRAVDVITASTGTCPCRANYQPGFFENGGKFERGSRAAARKQYRAKQSGAVGSRISLLFTFLCFRAT